MTFAAALALLFFAPLAFVYARHVAHGLHRASAASGRSPLRLAAWRVARVLFLVLALAVAIEGREALAIGLPPGLARNGGIRLALWLLDTIGGVGLLLFFLSVPYVMGSVFGIAAAASGRLLPSAAVGAPETDETGGPDAQRPVPRADRTTGTRRPSNRGAPERAASSRSPDPKASTQRTTRVADQPLIIAIDGPAAAGKGTLALKIAAHYALPYLDTGLLYRAIGKLAASRGVDLDDPEATAAIARDLDTTHLDDGTLRGREAGELASRVAVHPPVRAALEAFQRDFAHAPKGAVLDGRDIGTVICPDAHVKIFVTANPEVRARRRTDELLAKGREATFERILAEVRERDARDAGRVTAPLRAAEDAHLLDTSEMDIETAFQAACGLIDRSLAQRNGV